ncbi:hypothetical protein [Aeromonas veronii]|uniref:hypothetical protein n=1 Tax=Aeromonas veronii TaxID=654 RepID=UPI00241652AA|nr:hypothetical protein [Aeromonas veronii]WFO52175.1 hypothetical protein L1O00_03900 [Aeromonas veronii]
MNYFPPPDTYPTFIGTASLLVATVCLCITFKERQRSHATKLFSIMLVTSIAFFSSHWTTYFAAIFIVATAVTELEFLQNLAAIISKDKNYFDFKKEALSKEDNIRRKVEEAVAEEFASETSPSQKEFKSTSLNLVKLREQGHGATMRLALDIEEKALNLISKKYGEIERNVRIKQNNKFVEFDGFISSKENRNNKIFEVKWFRNPTQYKSFLTFSIRKMNDSCQVHEEITGYKPEAHLILVLNSELNADEKENINQRAMEHGVYVSFITLAELGYEIID